MKMEMVFQNLYKVDKIDLEEFTKLEKIIEDLNDEKYMISKYRFLENVLEKYQIYRETERGKVLKLLKEFDDNGDGVLQLDEFEVMIKHIEPSMSMKECAELFRQVNY